MKKGKVVLVYPRFLIQDGPSFNVPLSLLHLGSFIESQGYEVSLIDGNVESRYEEKMIEEAKKAVTVGFSAMTDQVGEARRLAVILKKRARLKTPVVFGGVHATLFPRQTIADPAVDFAVYGEGELPFLDLMAAIEGKKSFDRLEAVALMNPKHKYIFRRPQRRFHLAVH